MNFEDLSALMDALRDGTIEDADVARLDQLLAEHPEALDYFAERARLQADLEFALGGRTAAAVPLRRPRRRLWIAAAALLLLGLGGLLLKPAAPEPSYEGCAVLTRALNVRWDGPGPALGAALPKGRLAFSSGWIQVEFFSGARVILEGPADFELVGANEGLFRQGKLRAFVPPQAEGFTIRSAGMRIVDRGTEFGVRIDPSGDGEIHVFQGRVELQSAAAPRSLSAGSALRIGRAGGVDAIPANSESFLTLSELNLRSTEAAQRRFADWSAASARLRADPRMIAYYSFEDAPDWSRELRSQKAERTPLDGAVIGCRWAEGRWPGKRALEFKQPVDRVRLRAEGAYASLTLMSWVRVDSLDRPFSGLMLTDGWTTGSVHWQITQAGALRLGIRGEKQNFDYDSPILFESGQRGRWIHLATVYDREAREVRHFADGRLVRRLPLRFDTTLNLGALELGNWGVPLQGQVYSVRHLNGRMDEFALLDAPLSDEEIRAHHAVGAPAP